MAIRLLAFDLGAESGRAVLGTLERDRIGIVEKHRFANSALRRGRHLHWDLSALFSNIKLGLRDAGTLDGIGVDAWGVDYGLLDGDGNVIGEPFHYRDPRTDCVMEQVLAGIARERIYDVTGLQFLQFNTLFQLIAQRRDDHASLERAQTLLLMPDLFSFLLAGVRRTEPTIASTTQMYDPRRHDWANDLIGELDLPRRLLPPIEPVGGSAVLRDLIARECGIPACPVIGTSGHDTAAAVAAVPAQGGNWCFISSGTWSLMGVELSEPIISSESLSRNFTNEVGVGRSIRFLKNIMGLWLVQECRRELARQGHDYDYAQLTRLAGESSSCGAVIDPAHPPLLSPGDMIGKIAGFCLDSRQVPPSDHGQLIRCCLESLALTYRHTLDGLESLTGRRIETIHVVGGGSNNELLSQMTADACARDVVAGPVEATAIGNLLVQAMTIGAVPSLAHLRRIVADSFDLRRFKPRQPHAWDGLYDRYLEVTGR